MSNPSTSNTRSSRTGRSLATPATKRGGSRSSNPVPRARGKPVSVIFEIPLEEEEIDIDDLNYSDDNPDNHDDITTPTPAPAPPDFPELDDQPIHVNPINQPAYSQKSTSSRDARDTAHFFETMNVDGVEGLHVCKLCW